MTRAKYIVALIAAALLSGLVLAVIKSNSGQAEQSQSNTAPVLDLSDKLAAGASNAYTPFGTTTVEILSHENDTNKYDVVLALIWRLDQKSEKRGWENLSDTERRLIAVNAMNGEVFDGGFKQYFSTSLGADAEVALAGLKDMGATNTVQIMERAMAQFPGNTPPTNYDQRNTLIDKIETNAGPVWKQCDDAIYDQKEDLYIFELAYAKKKRADIILP